MKNADRNDRSRWPVKVGRLSDPKPEFDPEPVTPEQGLDMVWPLTLDIWAFAKGTDAESRLQRNVVRVIRGKS